MRSISSVKYSIGILQLTPPSVYILFLYSTLVNINGTEINFSITGQINDSIGTMGTAGQWLTSLGPGAGVHGGEVVSEGDYQTILNDNHTTADAIKLDSNRLILEDPFYKFRKGQYYHVYNSQEELKTDLEIAGFKAIAITNYDVDWFGTRETLFLFVATKN